MELVDLVVVGAGWSGLAVAKTYREVHPMATIVVLDDAGTIGGTWAQHRLYPGLKSNSMVGMYEFSDFPMDEATFEVKPGEFVPGPVVHQYLRQYAEKFDVYRLIRFGVTVETVERVTEREARWKLTTCIRRGESTTAHSKIGARKLVIATGLTSSPSVPSIPGSASSSIPLFHSRDLIQNVPTLETATRITVIGASKSAWDIVYEYASRGIHVDMIVRSDGRGPRWMAPPYVTPLKMRIEQLVHIRFLTWFSPCVWGEASGVAGFVRRALHGTGIGRRVVQAFFRTMGSDVMALNGYDRHPETAKLKPRLGTMLMGASGLAILNYPTDFFELVRTGIVTVHTARIARLSPHTVHLDSGVELRSDAVVCATGWKWEPGVKFTPESLESSLGLPSAAIGDEDSELASKSDEEIVTRFPSLSSSWRKTDGRTDLAAPLGPYRLYRFMVPPALVEERSIAFAGCMLTVFTPMIAQIQALWISSYFSAHADGSAGGSRDGDVAVPSAEKVMYETVLHTEFCKLRSPEGYGSRFPDMAFDTLAYLDLLLKDLGLEGRRKAWWRDWWDAYGPEDYKGLVQEWLAKRG